MHNKWQIILLSTFITTLAACSDSTTNEKPVTEKEHFMTEKMHAIKKAEQVEQLIEDAVEKQRRNIDEQGGY